MHHDAYAVGFVGELLERRLLGGARVDHERLGRLARKRNLRGEGALLILAWRALAVEIEAGLADREAALVRGERAQFGQIGAVEALGRVGMAADRRIHLGKSLGGGERGTARSTVDADREDVRDAGRRRVRDELGVGRFAQLEVRV